MAKADAKRFCIGPLIFRRDRHFAIFVTLFRPVASLHLRMRQAWEDIGMKTDENMASEGVFVEEENAEKLVGQNDLRKLKDLHFTVRQLKVLHDIVNGIS